MNPETSLRLAPVPDVLSKAPSLGRPWDPGCPFKSAWPAPFGTARGGGSGSPLWEVTQPWPVPGGPICNPGTAPPASQPPPLWRLLRSVCGTGHHRVQAPTRPCVSPRSSVLHGKNQAQATCQGLTRGPPTEPCRRHSALGGSMAKGPVRMVEALSISMSVLISSSSFCAVVSRPQRGSLC